MPLVDTGDGGNHYPACLSAISVLTLQVTFRWPLEWDFLAHICRVGSRLLLQALHFLIFADFPYPPPSTFPNVTRNSLSPIPAPSESLPIARADPSPRMPFPIQCNFNYPTQASPLVEAFSPHGPQFTPFIPCTHFSCCAIITRDLAYFLHLLVVPWWQREIHESSLYPNLNPSLPAYNTCSLKKSHIERINEQMSMLWV